MRLDRASPCGPVWPCVALCGPVWPCLALWPGGERGPSAQWSRPAEARGSLEHDVALSTRDASGAPAGRGLSCLWFAPLLPLICTRAGAKGELKATLCFILPEEKMFSSYYGITCHAR